jgi:hypothetical protein
MRCADRRNRRRYVPVSIVMAHAVAGTIRSKTKHVHVETYLITLDSAASTNHGTPCAPRRTGVYGSPVRRVL